jgi:hypothetical protein
MSEMKELLHVAGAKGIENTTYGQDASWSTPFLDRSSTPSGIRPKSRAERRNAVPLQKISWPATTFSPTGEGQSEAQF